MATTTKTQAKTPAKKAPAKAGGSGTAAAKKAAAKAPVSGTTNTARKLRWQLAEPKVNGAPVEQTAATADGHTYAIERSGEQWRATVTVGKKKTVLVELGSFGKCYQACVQANRTRA